MKKLTLWIRNILLIYLLCITFVSAYSMEEKYPSYKYVFHEFDVDESYLNNPDFILFFIKNEKRLKQFYHNSLRRGKDFLPRMQGQLVSDGVSDLFIYLSMIESGFSSTAVSSKKAVGLWQFMPATAKRFHLTVCNSYDERCDAVSSTSAAIQYLNKLHQKFGKWYLAAMAYNCGEGCIQKAIERAGSDDLNILTDQGNKYLPKETREYMKKILLVAMIGENSTLELNSPSNDRSFNGLIEVEVVKGTLLKNVAKLLKMKVNTLLKLNKKIKQGVVPTEKERYKITIPIEKVFAFYLRYEFPQEKRAIKPHLVSHYVTLGETIKSIANKYHADEKEIKIVNQLLENDYLTLGQLLVIPVPKEVFENTLNRE